MIELRIINNETPAPPKSTAPPPAAKIEVQPPILPVLALGFRPFFLLAGLHASTMILLWVGNFLNWWSPNHPIDPMLWHGHEMLFGYTIAVVAGFLLTAVPNWTSHKTATGLPLAALALLWIAARMALLGNWMPIKVAAALDLSFIPALAITLAIPLVKARQPRNLVFLPILGYLWLTNLSFWSPWLGLGFGNSYLGLDLGLQGILMMVAVIGGRVIPFFTRSAIPGSDPQKSKQLEIIYLGGIPVIAIGQAVGAHPQFLLAVCGAVGFGHLIRLSRWYDPKIWSIPLLWVLHLGYAWLGLGYLMKGLGAVGVVNPLLALHAFTVGCIGLLTLGMMARVSLGHGGRELKASAGMVKAFALLAVAAVTRTLVPLLGICNYSHWVAISGLLWTAAFLTFTWVYTPILSKPRADGKPG
jgi:uncharacterized protein involved in response to NO